MGTDSGFAPLIITDTGSVNGHAGIGPTHEDRAAEDRVHVRGSVRTAKPRLRAVGGTRGLPLTQPSRRDEELLAADGFGSAVQREMRRSERSRAPLSVVQYTIDAARADDPRHFEALLDILQASKRETDMLGYTEVDTLALLCPDTDAAGAAGLMAKLAPLLAGLPVAAAHATYPDHLFDSFTRKTAASPAFQALMVPETAARGTATYPLKSTLDFLLALVAIILLGPLMLAVAAIVKLTSEGPVIFRQTRLGKGGVPFTFYKFRSMVVNVDDRIHREYMERLIRAGHGEAATGANAPSFKMNSDPRVTRIGRIIRKTSIDELPQLFNVLKGDMSMVGPRPPIPYEASHYEPWHLQRILSAKPGITGLWQVEGRSRVTFTEMVRMDLRYIRTCSLILDLKLLVRTVAVVLRCVGAR